MEVSFESIDEEEDCGLDVYEGTDGHDETVSFVLVEENAQISLCFSFERICLPKLVDAWLVRCMIVR